MIRWGAALAIDLALVLVFAAVGRSSHAEGLTAAGVLGTAWPFLVGCLVGTAVAQAWRRPTALSTGAVVWAGTVVLGMVLRASTGGGIAVSFIVVAGIVLAAFLLGWRAVVRLVSRSKGRTRPTSSASPHP